MKYFHEWGYLLPFEDHVPHFVQDVGYQVDNGVVSLGEHS